MRIKILLPFAALLAVCAGSAYAADAPSFATDAFTGDWGGLRTRLYNEGVDIEGSYKLDAWRNLSGGIKTGNSVLDDLDLQVTLDGEKLYGLKGSTIYIYFLNNDGGHPNRYVGSNGGIDNIEVGTDTPKLYSAWIEQTAFDDKISVRAGLYDVNTEFYVTDASGLFINSTYGIGTEIAATGQNGPSIFPTTALGVRLFIKPADNIYLQGALLDGVPGDPNNPFGTHIQLDDKDGAFNLFEAGYKNEDVGHFAVGAWQYTARFDDFVDVTPSGDPVRKHNKGFYGLAEKTLYKGGKDGSRKIDGFVRFGTANGDVSRYSWSASAGFVYSGIFASRPDGQFGLGISNAADSDKLRESSKLAGQPLDKNETQIEATYSDKLTPWLSIQPDLQYTINPGTDPSHSNAWTAGIRLHFTL